MSKLFVLLWMLFNHVFDDYFLQGCLANLKQKSYWEKNAPDSFYKHDYIMALFMHSISWSFMIMLPLFAYFKFEVDIRLFSVFIINVLIHALTDHLKANIKAISLVQDQFIHLLQIITFWAVFMTL